MALVMPAYERIWPATLVGCSAWDRLQETTMLTPLCVDACVQVTPDGELLQCSTVADLVDFRFADDDQVRPTGQCNSKQQLSPGMINAMDP